MGTYKVADGFDVAEISLNTVAPQPRSEGVRPGRRSYGAGGAVYDESLFIELEFSALEDVTEFTTLLTAFGINAALTNEVTVLVPNQIRTFTRYNGIAVRPEVGRDVRHRNYFLRDVVILIKNLALSS